MIQNTQESGYGLQKRQQQTTAKTTNIDAHRSGLSHGQIMNKINLKAKNFHKRGIHTINRQHIYYIYEIPNLHQSGWRHCLEWMQNIVNIWSAADGGGARGEADDEVERGKNMREWQTNMHPRSFFVWKNCRILEDLIIRHKTRKEFSPQAFISII